MKSFIFIFVAKKVFFGAWTLCFLNKIMLHEHTLLVYSNKELKISAENQAEWGERRGNNWSKKPPKTPLRFHLITDLNDNYFASSLGLSDCLSLSFSGCLHFFLFRIPPWGKINISNAAAASAWDRRRVCACVRACVLPHLFVVNDVEQHWADDKAEGVD